MNREEILRHAIAEFPPTFGLRAFPGKVFRISYEASYVSNVPEPDTVHLCTQMQHGEIWGDFGEGTPAELRREIVLLTGGCE